MKLSQEKTKPRLVKLKVHLTLSPPEAQPPCCCPTKHLGTSPAPRF